MRDCRGSPETGLQRECVTRNGNARPPLSVFSVPVKGSACGHAPGKAFDALLSEERDGGQIGGHDGQ